MNAGNIAIGAGLGGWGIATADLPLSPIKRPPARGRFH
jgi:hypothetical protein